VGRIADMSPPANRLEATNSAAGRDRWTIKTYFIVLVVLGAALRFTALASDRNLWFDEAMLALNLVERSPAELCGPLDWNQGAPAGFLIVEKFAISCLGDSECGLRFVPFFASVLGLIAFAFLAVQLLPRPAALLAVGLMAVSPYVVSYSAECKQYASDASITVGLIGLASALLWGEGGTRRWVGLAAGGAAAVWFSHPAVFVLTGIGAALIAQAAVNKDGARLKATCTVIGCWLVSFAACYFLCLRQLNANNYLLNYWSGSFLPLPPKSLGDFAWLADRCFAPFAYPGGFEGTEIHAGGIATVLFVVGIWAMWKENWPVAVSIMLPAAIALLASGYHKYPFAGRLLLFLVPLMTLGVARGAWAVGAALWDSQRLAAIAFLGVLVLAPCLEVYQELRKPLRHEQIKPLLLQIRDNWQPGDRIYVHHGALPAFKYYTRDNPFPMSAIVEDVETRTDERDYRAQLFALSGSPRVWLVFSHRQVEDEAVIRAYAEGIGRCVCTVAAPGAVAYLFDFTRSGAAELSDE
jgi:hypothetical protein